MREITYQCDTCLRTVPNDDKLLTIGDYANENLHIKNHLPDRRIITMDGHGPIHFCSKKCFIDYFFQPENLNPL